MVVATKAGLTRQGPNKWAPVGRPEYLAQQLELSLRYLKLERIDLWQLHRIDAKVPVEESLGAMKKLQKQGKVRHIGLSEVKVREIEKARKIVEIVSVQNKYNLSDRAHEDVVSSIARSMGLLSFRGSLLRRASWPSRAALWMRRRRSMGRRSASFRWRGCCITRR